MLKNESIFGQPKLVGERSLSQTLPLDPVKVPNRDQRNRLTSAEPEGPASH